MKLTVCSKYTTREYYSVFNIEKILSAKKYINKEKKGLDAKKEVSGEDEWAHLADDDKEKSVETKIETKIEAADVADVGDRIVTFGKSQKKGEAEVASTIRDHVRNAMDAAGNTGQYIRFVNNHIDSQRIEIEKIKKIKEKFDHEIDLLQSNRTQLDDINEEKLSNNDVNSITESLKQLLLEKGITKSKLDTLKNEINEVEEELELQEDQIEEVSDEIKNKKTDLEYEENTKKINEEKIKTDLESLMKKYGVSNISDLEKLIK
jgi:chromosome segregation ATPase